MQQLHDKNDCGLVITGAGGVGKTRLTMEIAELAQTNAWTVLQLSARCDSTAIDELAKQLSPSQPVLFFCDYAETQKNLFDVLEAITDYHENHEYHFCYVTNCRTNYYEHLESLEGNQTIRLATRLHTINVVDKPNPEEADQGERVVRHILNRCEDPDPPSFETLCLGLPVLAVFVAYLNEKNQTTSLEALKQAQSFHQWITKRLQTSFGKEYKNLKRDLTKLLCQYPLGPAQQTVLRQQQPDLWKLHDQLESDGWVYEDDNDTFYIAHDVLADQVIVNNEQDRTPSQRSDIVRQSFDLGASLNNINAVLTAWQRVEESFDGLPWPKLFIEAIETNPTLWQNMQNRLVATPLLSLNALMKFKHQAIDYWQQGLNNEAFHASLGYRIRKAGRDKEKATHQTMSELIDWVKQILADSTIREDRLLCAALELDTDKFTAPMQAYLARIDIDFYRFEIAIAWLKAASAPSANNPLMTQWLEAPPHQLALPVVQLYRYWLRNKGSIELLAEPKTRWLNHHETNIKAHYLYKAWLDAGGECSAIETHLLSWLNAHQTTAEAGFVIAPWLRAKGDAALIQAHILKWLDIYQTTEGAEYVISAWLKAKGDLALIQAPMIEWLKTHQTSVEAGFVIGAWLAEKGELPLVHDTILEWLNAHQAADEASFIIRAWLRAKGDTVLIQVPVLKWLKANVTVAGAATMIRAWLEAKGDLTLIQTPMLEWLKIHQATTEAGVVFVAWLNSGGDLTMVELAIRKWINNGVGLQSPAMGFLPPAWLKSGGDSELIELMIEAQLKALWSPAKSPVIGKRFVRLYYMLTSIPETDNEQRWQQLLSMFGVWFNQYVQFEDQCSDKKWKAAQAPGIVLLTEMAINHYEIDENQNRTQLLSFFDWVDRWPENRRKKVAYKVATMKRDYGLN
ncbi:MAG: hypothetical protein MJK04_16370 [Psychrosphaera sp.]|nr:hypothetical protein [Psychrosphaera sp.]